MGGNDKKLLPGAAGASPLGPPHVPRCPYIIGARLCKWNWTITKLMVHPAWRCSWPAPCIKTTSIKKKRQVIVIRGSLLRGREGQICQLVSKVPWEFAFAGIWVHECWSLFKCHLLRVQKYSSKVSEVKQVGQKAGSDEQGSYSRT